MNIKKLGTPKAITKASENLPPSITLMKKNYDSFLQKIEKSDLANSETRYMNELVHIRAIKGIASNYGISDLANEMNEKETKILEKLKNDFGITFQE